MTVKIEGKEHPVGKVFCDDFAFAVPFYQRPYAWTTEEASELFEDLLNASKAYGSDSPDDPDPYFLGSLVLIKDDKPDAEIVDGQQRLTTLTILVAVIRFLLGNRKEARDLTKRLYEEADSMEGTPNRYRLTLRAKDADFFQTHIQEEGGIEKMPILNVQDLSDSQANIVANALLFLELLSEQKDDDKILLAQYIVQKCFLVVVSTENKQSAYRIFSVLNNRGMDLSHADILKADVVGNIGARNQEQYAKVWEETEEQLGRDSFNELFGHIRMIYKKAKVRNILDELQKDVVPKHTPEEFIDKVLCPYADSFAVIQDAEYQYNRADELNPLLQWLGRIDNRDWYPPAIAFHSKNPKDSNVLVPFFADLERLASAMFIMRTNINNRILRYASVLVWIEKAKDLYASDSPLQLTPQEKSAVREALRSPLYGEKFCAYTLLRLDSHLSGAGAVYNHSVISVEHVLPQTVDAKSAWVADFPTDLERACVNDLGNLVLLSRRKNSAARNWDFDKKKQQYFAASNGGSTPFVLTGQVIGQANWTPTVVAARQAELLKHLVALWRL